MTDHITCTADLNAVIKEEAALTALRRLVEEARLEAMNLEYHGVEFAPIRDEFDVVRVVGSVTDKLDEAGAQIAVEIENRKQAISDFLDTASQEYA